MPQSGTGKISIMQRFIGGEEDLIANTAVDNTRLVGEFKVVGQGMADTDSGAPIIDAAVGGAVRLTTTNEDQHTLGLETNRMFDVGLMGTIVAEVRLQAVNLTTKRIFMGFTDIEIASNVPSMEVDLGVGSTTTITNTASDICGFLLDSELTASTSWHGMHVGGTAAAATDSTTTVLTPIHTAGDWQILRLEIDNNGTARWKVDEDPVLSVTGAVSTTVNLKFFVCVEATAATIATLDLNYIMLKANQDWVTTTA